MTDNSPEVLSPERAQAILERVAPGSSLLNTGVLPGSFSNYTHLVTARGADRKPFKIVVRRYKVFGEYDRGEKASREFKTFELLDRHQVPAPVTLLLDESGDILGSPGIVTRFVEGRLMLEAPADVLDWSRKLATTLAQIHSIPCGKHEKEFLLDGNEEAAWFLKSSEPPGYMQEYRGGTELWQIMRARFADLRADTPCLLHIDYWSGNILWHENEISAVLDWEEAAYGDPAIDVGYARMNLILMGSPGAADEFLHVYESVRARRIRNLGFWELAAAVRPMIDPVDWNVHEGGSNKNIFLQFIEDAKRR